MIIEEQLIEVTLGDGKIYFAEPDYKFYFEDVAAAQAGDRQKFLAGLWDCIKKIENIFNQDGSPLTVEQIKAGKFPVKLGSKIEAGWNEAITKYFATSKESEEKKDLSAS